MNFSKYYLGTNSTINDYLNNKCNTKEIEFNKSKD